MSSAEVRAHSAIHVLMGAVVKVMGPLPAASTRVGQGEGTLSLRSERAPTPEEVERISSEANRKIREDAEVVTFRMGREEAEGHFGRGIYDLGGVPEGALLGLVRIPDWETSVCGEAHVGSTGEIRGLELVGARFGGEEGLLELDFRLG